VKAHLIKLVISLATIWAANRTGIGAAIRSL